MIRLCRVSPAPKKEEFATTTKFKEYQEIKAKNKKEKNTKSSAEFLSGLKKIDRLHPVISICVYYGDTEWNGPRSLTDMLEIPDR